MQATQAYQQYQTLQTQTADQCELVLMLYQGAIKFLTRASVALERRNLEDAHSALIRSQDIIAELMGSLNMEAGEIAVNLFRIYEFMHYSLIQANLRKDPAPVQEVMRLMRELLPAWQEAVREVRAARSEAPARDGKGITCLVG